MSEATDAGAGKPVRRERPPGLVLATANARVSYASYARALVDSRRSIGRYVRSDLFGDPAWEMMLDLFVAREDGATRSVAQCAAGSRMPRATALRYLRTMMRDGIVRIEGDPRHDGGGAVHLTRSAAEGVRDWLASISTIPLRRSSPADPPR